MGNREPPILHGRVPPNDLGLEAAVLSASLLDEEARGVALEILQPPHFYSDNHRLIFTAIGELEATGAPVDVALVASWLRDRQLIERAGGTRYLGEIVDATPAVENVAEHAERVRTKWRMRQLIGLCQKRAALGYGDVGNEQEFIDETESLISEVAHVPKPTDPEPVKAILTEKFKRLKEAADRGERVSGVPTRFIDLDKKTAGLHPGDLMVVAARPGMGKAQPLSARVLTPTGWRTMGNLRVGDRVIGASGQPVRVLGVYDQGEREVFRVTMRDGGSTRACAEHLWETRTRAQRRGDGSRSVRSTAEIRATLHRGDGIGINHSVRRLAPVRFDTMSEALPLDPYVLGVWLGDGGGKSSPMIHNPETDVLERVRERLPTGDRLVHAGRCSWRVKGAHMLAVLRELGLSGRLSWEKFIPEMYLRASVEDRIELLRGLCDTDGYVTQPRLIEYTTTSMQLMAGIVELVGGLGGTCTWKLMATHYTKDGERVPCRMAARARVRLPTGDIVPVTSAKHLARWKRGPGRLTERYIESVEPDGVEPCRCIRVDAADRLYVTDDFIVTHNTSFVLNVAVNVASPWSAERDQLGNAVGEVVPGHGVAVFSLEMPKDQVATRIVCSEGRVDLQKMRHGYLNQEDWEKLAAAGGEVAKLPIFIDDTPALGLLELKSKCRRLRAHMGRLSEPVELGLVIIDYLQLMSGRRGAASREQEISEISRGCKQLAKELAVPVIALSQLNRGVETRGGKDKRPMLSDLRESGAIEQDSDTIIFIYRDEYYNKETTNERGIAELIIAKQRNGPTGIVRTRFISSYTRFEDLAPGEFEEFEEFG